MMKISIITVSFNAASSIGHTLQSVAAQDYGNVEHIVVDGGSMDGTLDIIKQNEANLACVVSEPDRGIYDAMNKGIRLATGDLIGLLNAGDVYASHSVLGRVAQAMEHPPLDALYGDVEFFSMNDPGKTIRRYRSARFSPARIAWGWMPAHPTLFLQRAVFDTYGLYKTDFRIAGDYEFIARIFKSGALRYRYLAEVLVRMSSGGISTGGWRNTIRLNQEVLRACRENGIKTSVFKLLSKYPIKALEFVLK